MPGRGRAADSGTLVAARAGAGVVVATGRATELGRISGLIGGVERLATQLLHQMDVFARRLTAVVLGAAALREEPGGMWVVAGDPMEEAPLAFVARAGEAPETARIRFPHRDAIPFDSRYRFMATLHADHDRAFVWVKGAPEHLVAMCDRQRGLAGEEPLITGAWHARVEAFAAGGMRVIAVATRSFPHNTEALAPAMVETGLVLGALLGLIDPPREEAVAAVAECQAAGIRVKMITGDHAATAGAIAREVGLRGTGDVVTGTELDRLDVAALRARARASLCLPGRSGVACRLMLRAPPW